MVIGIDLGTTNSVATAFKDGESILIPNEYGEFLTPSVVGFDDNNELIVGKIAKERLVVAPNLTTSLFKRKMGQDVKVKLGEKEFSPEELSSFVLRKLITDAELFLGGKVEEVVVSVPAYFNSKQRAATKKAGQLAGIKVERLVNEPSAAAIACLDEDEDDTFIVFDFGGGTLDVSVVERFDNIINICAISGDNFLGGRDFDSVIFKTFCDENDIIVNDLSKSQQQTLLRVAEEAKMALQFQEKAQLQVVIDDKMLRMDLTNEKLAELAKDIFTRIRKPIAQAMKDSGLEAADISKLILVGGSCEMKIVQNYLKKLLQIPVVNHNDTDKIVAKGLGIYVGIKERSQEVKDLVLTDICPFSLSIGALDFMSRYISAIMISRNSVLPTSVTKDFYTGHAGQKVVDLKVYQGEEMYADDNMLLGELQFDVPENMNGYERIDVTFFYDINSILVVKAMIASTKEVFTYVLGGDGLEVTGVKSKKYLDQHSHVDIKFAQHERQTFILERAKRIYAEGNSEFKPHMQMIIGDIENIMEISSLRKLNEILDEYEAILEEIEKAENKIDLFSDLFSDFDNEDVASTEIEDESEIDGFS